MYWIAACVAVCFLLWGIAARKEEAPVEGERVLKPFYRMAFFLYKRMHIWNFPVFTSSQVRNDLERLHPGEAGVQLQTEFYVKKLGLMLLIILAGTVICTGVKVQRLGNRRLLEGDVILRTEFPKQEGKVIMEAQIPGIFQETFEIQVPVRQLQRPEAELLMEQFWSDVCKKSLQGNPSSDQVAEDLWLLEELESYPFTVSWTSSRPEIISRSGRVTETEERVEVLLTAVITYEDMEWSREFTVKVIPPVRTETERIHKELEQLLHNTEESSRTKEQWRLPAEWEGQEILWKERAEENSLLLWALALLTAFGIYFLTDKDLHGRLEERRKQMKEAYPLIINKMVLYLGAGLTVRSAYRKIAEDYQIGKEQGIKMHPAYEEMLYTCHELAAGMSEGAAYERFGRRSGLQEYIKFSALLTQNIKKGNRTLLDRLREEGARSMQERIHHKKQAGEEAATKLLVPMVMMLAVIMIMIILPAFTSFGI